MKKLLILGLLTLGGCQSFTPTEPMPGMPATVASVDIERYLGTWFEQARLPIFFQDGERVRCEDVTAIYTARRDGAVDVLNTCRNALQGGARRSATAVATPVPGSNNARLRVAFFWPFHGDYWIIGLDPEYRWAVVGAPSRRVLWILSRGTEMPPADFDRAVEIARREGFAVQDLQRTPQSPRVAAGGT